jgi:hypothetical protein
MCFDAPLRVLHEAPNGGAVFWTGSIYFLASLSPNDYKTTVSRMIKNVVIRFFFDETEFAI